MFSSSCWSRRVGVQRAGADRLFDLQAEGGARGLDEVDVVLRTARVVLELVHAGRRAYQARAGQFQLLRGGAAIQADRAVVVAQGDAAAAAGAAVDGDEFAEHVAVADHQLRTLAGEFLVLRLATDRRVADEAVVAADPGRAMDAAMGADHRVRPDR
ncbi:hypothetical protein G6F32_014514 [Rhizopus arrhizus]|nr:hypothetical protein G6F32_014514 [Rhizopus arrhizus]